MNDVILKFELKELYEKWACEKKTDAGYEEPDEGWDICFSSVYKNGDAFILFKSVNSKRENCYRLLMYRLSGNKAELVNKYRFCRYDKKITGIEYNKKHIYFSEENADGTGYSSIPISVNDDTPAQPLEKVRTLQKNKKMMTVVLEGCLYIKKLPSDSSYVSDGFNAKTILRGKTNDKASAENAGKEKDGEKKKDSIDCEERLAALIGLESVKKQVKGITDYTRFCKRSRELGKDSGSVNVNLAFTGNPGTAKTTVARILADIFRKYGVVSNGELIEVGRADIVGQFVGQTAPKVKKLFSKAKGNVLFIDEAYSLCDGGNNDFGSEAVAAIVQEMENNREDTVVIFAGYPGKMQEFLAMNPGLRSRVPFVVDFPDYSEEELFEIAVKEAKDDGYTITENGMEKLRGLCSQGTRYIENGNGRFCRNLIEKAKLTHASNVYAVSDEPDLETMFTFDADDLSLPDSAVKNSAPPQRRIGFAAA